MFALIGVVLLLCLLALIFQRKLVAFESLYLPVNEAMDQFALVAAIGCGVTILLSCILYSMKQMQLMALVLGIYFLGLLLLGVAYFKIKEGLNYYLTDNKEVVDLERPAIIVKHNVNTQKSVYEEEDGRTREKVVSRYDFILRFTDDDTKIERTGSTDPPAFFNKVEENMLVKAQVKHGALGIDYVMDLVPVGMAELDEYGDPIIP